LRSLAIPLLHVQEFAGLASGKGINLFMEFPEEFAQTLQVHG